MSSKDMNPVEDFVGRTTTGFAIIVAAIILACLWYYHEIQDNQRQLRNGVTQVCAKAQNFQACATRVTTVLKTVQTHSGA